MHATVDLELEEQAVAAGLGELGGKGQPVRRVHVLVREVALVQRDEVPVRADVRVEPRDGTAAALDGERELGLLPRAERRCGEAKDDDSSYLAQPLR